MPTEENFPGPHPTNCDHCGTVQRALTIWPDNINCDCWCHKRRQQAKQNAAKTKNKKKTR